MGPDFINEVDINNDEVQYIFVINNNNIAYNAINYVHHLPMDLFRAHVIDHFDTLFCQNKIL